MSQVDPELQKALQEIHRIAAEHRTDLSQLLEILRQLESAHRTIVDEIFIPALPTSRRELFNLLLEIESHGGWPYIYRIKLQQFRDALAEEIDQLEQLERQAQLEEPQDGITNT